MLKIKFPEGISGASHDGISYYPDEEGHAELGLTAPERVIQHFQGLGFEVIHVPEPEQAGDENSGSPEGSEGEDAATSKPEGSEAAGEPDSGGAAASEAAEKPAEQKAEKKAGKKGGKASA